MICRYDVDKPAEPRRASHGPDCPLLGGAVANQRRTGTKKPNLARLRTASGQGSKASRPCPVSPGDNSIRDGVRSFSTRRYPPAAPGFPRNGPPRPNRPRAGVDPAYTIPFPRPKPSENPPGRRGYFLPGAPDLPPINFNSPYNAVNFIDFWRRWHMSLSRFLRDYLYLPLGGNRQGKARRYS